MIITIIVCAILTLIISILAYKADGDDFSTFLATFALMCCISIIAMTIHGIIEDDKAEYTLSNTYELIELDINDYQVTNASGGAFLLIGGYSSEEEIGKRYVFMINSGPQESYELMDILVESDHQTNVYFKFIDDVENTRCETWQKDGHGHTQYILYLTKDKVIEEAFK